MCEFCDESAFTTIIEHEYEVYADNYFGNVHIHEESYEQDNSVVFEMRCGSGYIRLGDRSDMNCIDHEAKYKVNYCFNCGRKLGDD